MLQQWPLSRYHSHAPLGAFPGGPFPARLLERQEARSLQLSGGPPCLILYSAYFENQVQRGYFDKQWQTVMSISGFFTTDIAIHF